jgi:hypothetical protein
MSLGFEYLDGRENIEIPSYRDSKELKEEASVNRWIAEDYDISEGGHWDDALKIVYPVSTSVVVLE